VAFSWLNNALSGFRFLIDLPGARLVTQRQRFVRRSQFDRDLDFGPGRASHLCSPTRLTAVPVSRSIAGSLTSHRACPSTSMNHPEKRLCGHLWGSATGRVRGQLAIAIRISAAVGLLICVAQPCGCRQG
jgi:hypothetical protein